MTASLPALPWLGGLPVQSHPARPFLDLAALVPLLMELYPLWAEDDLRCFIEEKTRSALHPEDLITFRAVYQRGLLARKGFDLP